MNIFINDKNTCLSYLDNSVQARTDLFSNKTIVKLYLLPLSENAEIKKKEFLIKKFQ